MVGHQRVSVNPATRLARASVQPVETGAVILVREEARLPIVTALDQVERDIRQRKTRTAGHGDGPFNDGKKNNRNR
jgi:hypothetical protein